MFFVVLTNFEPKEALIVFKTHKITKNVYDFTIFTKRHIRCSIAERIHPFPTPLVLYDLMCRAWIYPRRYYA